MRALAAALGFAVALPVMAGTHCGSAEILPEQLLHAIVAGDKAEVALKDAGDVALIARVGQDLSAYGVRFSHMGFAVRTDEGWRVVHKLNTCGEALAGIYEQSLPEFFMDSEMNKAGGLWLLNPKFAQALKPLLTGPKMLAYHEPRYSMVQYPFNDRYQNSNGWVLEVLAAGLGSPTPTNRQEALAWLAQHNYAPQVLAVDWRTRFGARLTQAHIAFDDHPPEMRWNGKIATITVGSVIDFLRTQPSACEKPTCEEKSVTLEP